MVEPYLRHGSRPEDREYLTDILETWSAELDPDNYIERALHEAITKGEDVAVQTMLDAGLNPMLRQLCDPGFTPLLAAAQLGRLQLVAARNNQVAVTAYLLEIWDGWTEEEKLWALTDAAWAWCDETATVLLSKVSYEAGDIQEALEKVVDIRVMLAGFDVRRGITADDCDSQQRLVCRLIDAGGNPDGEDRGNHWPLVHIASTIRDCIGALKELLERGADPNCPGPQGKNALHRTCSSFRPDTTTLETLLQHGALPDLADDVEETALHAIAGAGTLAQLQLCLSYCGAPDGDSIQLLNSHGESLLHYAAAGGREDDMLEFLLASGLDVNMTNDNGWTPLMCALMSTKTKPVGDMCRAAETLLRHGARADLMTDEDWTPLHALGSWHLRWQRPGAGADIGGWLGSSSRAARPSMCNLASSVALPAVRGRCVIYGGFGCAGSWRRRRRR
ncbi:hypothetical protein PG996_003315 [Apiospora saccharicola]|uniref:Ankyrin repeat protein n=1 Tax=Apiospora saccharicola TaxID=335842 RepID=A0ABR1W0Y9_9PEZI